MVYLILLLGLIVRLININQSLWLDEAINVLAVRDFKLFDLITIYSPGDFHPPLYHVILWFWIRLFGTNEISVRLLSVVFGLGTLWVSYLLIKKFFSEKQAILSTILLATSPLHIYYSQEARMYMETAFFAIVSVYFFLNVISEDKKCNLGSYIGFIISTTLLLYSEYVPYFLVLSQNLIYLPLIYTHKRLMRKWLLSLSFILLMLIPWLPYLWLQFNIAIGVARSYPLWSSVVGQASWKTVPLLITKFLIGHVTIQDKLIYGSTTIPLILLVGILSLNYWKAGKDNRINKVVIKLLIYTILIPYLISFYISVFAYFRFIFLLPLFYLILSYSPVSYNGNFYRFSVVFILLVINITSLLAFNYNHTFWREDWRGAVSFIEENERNKQSGVMFVNSAQEAGYLYYSKNKVPLVSAINFQSEAYENIWLFRYVQEIFDPGDSIRHNLEEAGFHKINEYEFNGIIVWKFSK